MEKQKNLILAIVANVIFYLVIFLKLDSTYYINDDLMIQDIISGAFLGEVNYHTVYMNSALSGLIAFGYQILPGIPWFGVYFYACYFLCTTFVLYRGLCAFSTKLGKILLTLTWMLVIILLLLKYIVLIHYTLLAAVMGGTALFLFVSEHRDETALKILKNHSISIFLLILTFLTRSQVFYMLLPFLAGAGIYKISLGKNLWIELKKYIPLLLITFGVVFMLFVVDKVPYTTEEWEEYKLYNDARTNLYDYAGIPEYDKHMDFYSSIHMTKEQVSLISSYNLLLDSSITKEQLQSIAEYYEMINYDVIPTKERVKYAVFDYVKRVLLEPTDFPYSYLVLGLYGGLLYYLLSRKRWFSLASVCLLGMARSFVWIFLIFQRRFPERVSLSLFTIEILLLIGFILLEVVLRRENETIRSTGKIEKLVFLILFIFLIYGSFMKTVELRDAYNKQHLLNQEADQLYEYIANQEDNFYLFDVYSVARYSKKVFQTENMEYKNYLLLGGWITGSPLASDKLTKYGTDDVFKLLFEKKNIFFVTDGQYSTDYLLDFFESKGIQAEFEIVDKIASGTLEFTIFRMN